MRYWFFPPPLPRMFNFLLMLIFKHIICFVWIVLVYLLKLITHEGRTYWQEINDQLFGSDIQICLCQWTDLVNRKASLCKRQSQNLTCLLLRSKRRQRSKICVIWLMSTEYSCNNVVITTMYSWVRTSTYWLLLQKCDPSVRLSLVYLIHFKFA